MSVFCLWGLRKKTLKWENPVGKGCVWVIKTCCFLFLEYRFHLLFTDCYALNIFCFICYVTGNISPPPAHVSIHKSIFSERASSFPTNATPLIAKQRSEEDAVEPHPLDPLPHPPGDDPLAPGGISPWGIAHARPHSIHFQSVLIIFFCISIFIIKRWVKKCIPNNWILVLILVNAE